MKRIRTEQSREAGSAGEMAVLWVCSQHQDCLERWPVATRSPRGKTICVALTFIEDLPGIPGPTLHAALNSLY